jgi:hypothetical protein
VFRRPFRTDACDSPDSKTVHFLTSFLSLMLPILAVGSVGMHLSAPAIILHLPAWGMHLR